MSDIIHEEEGWEIKRLSDAHEDDYAIRHGPVYAEFSSGQKLEKVYLIGPYISLRHSVGEGDDVPDGVAETLDQIL